MRTGPVLAVVLGVILMAGAAQAAKTNYVSLAGTSVTPPYTSWELATTNIQDAINDAVAGDTVLVSNGTYWINSDITIAQAITVRSLMGAADTTVIRATVGTNLPHHRIFTITANATVDGFTAQNGYLPIGGLGGGINMSAGTVQNCVIFTNVVANDWASRGGGVYMAGSSKLQFCTVVSNSLPYSSIGGGVYATGNALLISNTVAYNTGDGATLNLSPKVTFCVFEHNIGSGVYGGSGPTLSNCVMRFNRAGSGGGYYGVNAGTLTDCTIVSNSASVKGGGVYHNGAYVTFLMQRCVISGNTSPNYPGVHLDVSYDPACLRIFDLCRITDNGGRVAVYMQGRPEFAKFRNCTISANQQAGVEVNNLATNASGAFLYPSFVNTIVYGFATNIFSTNAAVFAGILTNSFTNCCSPQLTAPGMNNVTADPVFAKPSAGDYRLHVSSPCVNAGTTNVLSAYTRDIEALLWGSSVNMGCYKTVVTPQGTRVTLH